MKLVDLRSIDQLRDFLEGTQEVEFAVLTGKYGRHRWMQQTLIKFGYRHLSKADKGIVILYLMKMSGYSLPGFLNRHTMAVVLSSSIRISISRYRISIPVSRVFSGAVHCAHFGWRLEDLEQIYL